MGWCFFGLDQPQTRITGISNSKGVSGKVLQKGSRRHDFLAIFGLLIDTEHPAFY